jgi:hypothetical protein
MRKDERESQYDQERRVHDMVAVMEPFQDRAGTVYWLFDREDGAPYYLEYEGAIFRGKLAMLYMDRYGESIPRRDLDMASDMLQAKAAAAAKRDVWLRVAKVPEQAGVALDLANDENGMMVVTPTEIRYEPGSKAPPCYFRRPDGILEIPSALPTDTPPIDLLQQVAPLPDFDSQLIRLAFLLSCLWPEGPYPILSLVGPPESGKGFHASVIRALVDPVNGGLQGLPSREDDLLDQCGSLRLLVLDNLSQFPPWAFDALCRISTGSTSRRRRLYTNRSMMAQPVRNPIITTSVDRILTTPDLVSRSMLIELPHIEDEGRWDESDALNRVREQTPYILWGLLRIIQQALFIRPDQVPASSRITPIFRLMLAAETLYGWNPGVFSRIYNRNRGTGHDTILSEYSWAAEVPKLLNDFGGEWSGTYNELLNVMRTRIPAHLRGDNFPNSAKAMSHQVQRTLHSFLDYSIRFDRDISRSRFGKVIRIFR